MENVPHRASEKPAVQTAPARVFAASKRDAKSPVITQVEFGSAWYHEAAIQNAEKSHQHRS